MGRRIASVVVLAISVAACGGRSLTEPDPGVAAPPPGQVAQAALPPHIFGAFAASADVPEIGPQGGNVVVVVPSYSDDPERVALALQGNGKTAIVTAHHVFGNPRAGWVAGWQQLREWMRPLEARGLVAAVYVVDEPLHNGIPAATRDEAIAIVRSAGYRTIVAEGIDRAIGAARPPVDLYGVTCYDWPGYGGWSQARCLTAYRDRPSWDLVIGQGFDLHPRNGTAQQQLEAWAALGRERAGVLFWVARWPGQMGILDDGELLAAYREAATR